MSMVQGLDYEDLQDYACQLEDENKRLRECVRHAISILKHHHSARKGIVTLADNMQEILEDSTVKAKKCSMCGADLAESNNVKLTTGGLACPSCLDSLSAT